MNEPTLKERLSAAIFIIAFGAEHTGMMTHRKLMWPYTDYEADDLKRAAARLLASVHTELLTTLLPVQTERISKDLASYLSFVHGDGWPDEKIESPEDE